MANMDTLTTEELDLRRRARRRLVGAVALALLAVVVLPMLFNPEPKPLGPGVDIRIPDPSTPFPPGMPAQPSQAPEAEDTPQPAQDQTARAAPEVASAPAESAAPPVTPPRQPTPAPSRDSGPTAAKPSAPTAAMDAKRVPASEPFAARGYYLQLGAFTSEANARQLADKARAAGFDVAVQEVGGQVRVRMGPYAERSQALEMQAKLRAKGFGTILLGP
jgi:DedD protein